MCGDFPDKLREWRTTCELGKAAEEKWKSEVRDAHKKNIAPPAPPSAMDYQEPQMPRLRQHDVTIEKVAGLLATAAPKGLMVCRDELSGWIDGMTAYNPAGRQFWIEAYGGRPFRVERQKHPEPIVIRRLAVAVFGGTQPEKLAMLMRDADDGLLSRMLWFWPAPIPFYLGRAASGLDWATAALDLLRTLDLQTTSPAQPLMVQLDDAALPLIESFGQKMQRLKNQTGGQMRATYGKARGHALRLALNLEFMWWCGTEGFAAPPMRISKRAFLAAAALVEGYFVPMAERVFGDAALPEAERLAAIVARWIIRLPGLREAEKVRLALDTLVEADWLMPDPTRAGGAAGRRRVDYAVNPRLKGVGDVE